jgi:cell division protein ZapA
MTAKPVRIKITIAERIYPVVVKSQEEEEGMRKASKKINKLVGKFEQNYAVNDKQDVLAMCALQFASLVEIENIESREKILEVNDKLKSLNEQITSHLEEHS